MTRHVILLTYGEPPHAAFAPQLAYSWRILWGLTRRVAPIPPFLLPFIALWRARFRVGLWRRHGYSSPIEAITHRQARALEQALSANDHGSWSVHVAYEFRRPLLEDAIAAIPSAEAIAVVPMYVAESEFTHDIARAQLATSRARVVAGLDAEVLGELSARHILGQLAERGVTPGADWALVLAAHGTLLDPPRPMNTGLAATEAVAEAIERRLAPHFGRVQRGWLNHTVGGAWTVPAADVAVRDLVAAGFRHLVYFPYGFLADNAESQLEGRMLLMVQPGLDRIEHLPCLNESAELARALAEAVGRTLEASLARVG